MKKRAFALLTALLLCLSFSASAEEAYRMLKSGSVGDDVKAMKVRLYELGYYRTTALNDGFTSMALSCRRHLMALKTWLKMLTTATARNHQ